MANPRYSDVSPVDPQDPAEGAPLVPQGPTAKPKADSTANWPGLPGKTQPRDRSGGTGKIKEHAKSVGI